MVVHKLVLSFGIVLCFVGLASSVQAATFSHTTAIPCRDGNPTCWPDAFAFTPKENIYYVERFSGQVRIHNFTRDTDKRFITINNLAGAGEQGLLGIALHPAWPEKKWVYLYYTKEDPLRNEIIRVKKKADGTFKRELLLRIPASTNHNGGVIHFGPDGKLYVVTGENYNQALAQDLDSRAGKILRLNKDGSIPADNPFGNYVFSYGHRNSYGFTFDPFDSDTTSIEVWQTENGPDCNDELNFVQSGLNYGWGESADCPETNNSGSDPVDPTYSWTDPLAVTGAAFCQGCGLGSHVAQQLVVGAYNTGQLFLATLNSSRDGVTEVEELYDHGSGGANSGILGVEASPNGEIFYSDPQGIYQLQKD